MTEVVSTIAGLRARLGTGAGQPVQRQRAVVMTMGALHDGHVTLMKEARAWLVHNGFDDADLVVTIFVNPLQFTNATDLQTYPRTLDSDLERCREAGVDVVFAPTAAEMYPHGDPVITVDPGSLGADLEALGRPGHFRGMLTVVNRLLMLTGPVAAHFGEKDYQQLALIKQMVTDLLIPTTIVGVPTVREPDGLAMSSRNRRLSASARKQALAVPGSLALVQRHLDAGADPQQAAHEAAQWLAAQPGIDSVGYVEVRSRALGEAPTAGEARALVAAVVDGVRLIDNVSVTIGAHA